MAKFFEKVCLRQRRHAGEKAKNALSPVKSAEISAGSCQWE
jgi:hypothetical protein